MASTFLTVLGRLMSVSTGRDPEPETFAVLMQLEGLEQRLLLSATCEEDHDHDLHALPPVDLSLVAHSELFADVYDQPEAVTSIFDNVPLSQTFTLHSLPGANHTIYLDFDGHVTTGTSWNNSTRPSITSPAYDFDGNTASFSDTELQRIQYIWQRVAEDYLPFNVNVTTQDPGAAALSKSGTGDTQWGGRVVIGGSSLDWFGSSAGGVAYVGSFNSSVDTPSFVFPAQLGNGNEKYVAEAISHEAGHMVGLSHDGTSTTGYYGGHGSGTTGWAPIMGVGYYQNLSQWSKGEYADANQKQDDLTIITTNNGFGYRSDDFGNVTGSAGQLALSGSSVSATGIIERGTDVDLFSFTTGSGNVSFNVNPASRGPNLDILVELLNASSSVILASNPASLLNATLSTTLAAGTYFLRVSGVGNGDPLGTGYSDYGSLGLYSISGTVVPAGATFSVNDVAVNENAGTATFTVSLSQALASPASVSIATANGSALAGSDYAAASATLNFPAGVTTQTFTVSILDDTLTESDETFSVLLSNASSGTTIADGSGLGTIVDNDLPPLTITVNDASVTERDLNKGNKGGPQTSNMVFTVNLSRAATSNVVVNYATANGTATAGTDYQAATGTLTILAGQSSGTITVTVIGDTAVEGNENFTLSLTGVTGAAIADGSATGTIVDNDSGGGGGGGKPPKGQSNTARPVTTTTTSPGALALFQYLEPDLGWAGHPETLNVSSDTILTRTAPTLSEWTSLLVDVD